MPAGNAAKARAVLRRLCIAAFCLVASQAAYSKVHIPPCTLEQDPDDKMTPLSLCLEGRGGSWVEQRSNVDNEDHSQPPLLHSTSGRATLLGYRWFTLQVEGHHRIWQARNSKTVILKDSARDTLLLQIGNYALHRHRIFAGESKPTFGLNLDTNAAWTGFETTKFFYGKTMHLAGYTYDNQKDITWTISSGAENDSSKIAEDRRLTISSRISYDISALEGTRLLTSFSTNELSERHAGFAMMNMNGKGEVTTIEVVRTWKEFAFDPNEFNQLIRVNWSGRTAHHVITRAQFEDIWNRSRIGSAGIEVTHWEHFMTTVTAGFHKSEDNVSPNYWFGVLGVEAKL